MPTLISQLSSTRAVARTLMRARSGMWAVAIALAVAAAMAWSAPSASALPVLVLAPNGHLSSRNDPAPAWAAENLASPKVAGTAQDGPGAYLAGRNVRTELRRLFRAHRISRPRYRQYLASFNAALHAVRHLSGTRSAELEAVIENLHLIAADGGLTRSRLPVLFQTLDRNKEWWTSGPLPSSRQIVGFTGSQIDWEYYPGQGLQIQPLASFGKAAWFFTHGRRYYTKGSRLLAELIPLAAHRAGGQVWEYYFNFDGGVPPWASAMAQGTALQALADGYAATGDKSYLQVGVKALPVFRTSPPTGVAVRTARGLRFVQYTFASAQDEEIINAFLQTVIGLGDFARVSRNPIAARLFAKGNAEAKYEVPQYDTGAWSLYQPGMEDDLSYHQLVTGFLMQLCSMTSAHAYCRTAARFERDLTTPPVLSLLTHRWRARTPSTILFRVSKVSRVGITIVRNGRTLFLTSGDFPYGEHAFSVPSLPRGRYQVRLDATDLAGNYGQKDWQVRVTRR